MIKTLDVTLRDGGYRNNFHFNNEDINHIIASLTKTGIDYLKGVFLMKLLHNMLEK